jgi:MFS family permease
MDMDQATVEPTSTAGRPTKLLPVAQLLRLSLYWLGLSAIFQGLGQINVGRLEFTGLVEKGHTGEALFLVNIVGAIVAVIIQPTIGVISDYTTSRWGRRKPYIFVGSILDLVFLIGIANSNTLISIAAFIVLLQFSSNLAQGPFQGYVPDLVPAPQVGLASALVGLMQIMGNIVGFGLGAIAVGTGQFGLGLIALGVLEVVTMLSVVIRVEDGRAPLPRAGRSWLTIARSAWGADILRERSYLWLVASRLFILMAGALLITFTIPYLHRTLGLAQDATTAPQIAILALVALGNIVAIVPAARISDRIGRKPIIYASCAIGAVGVGIVAIAPNVPVAVAGAGLFGISAGMFLAVDWALMTDIIPKASSGRYMGISNLATGSAGTLAQLIGGALVMDTVGAALGDAMGPRATMGLAVVCYAIGAVLLRPVDERRREDDPIEAPIPAELETGAAAG